MTRCLFSEYKEFFSEFLNQTFQTKIKAVLIDYEERVQ